MDKEEGVVRNEGIDRRRLLKRGAVVGGTLLWAAPLIQSIGPAAQAHQLSPGTHGCCECLNCPPGVTANDRCSADRRRLMTANEQACADYCSDLGCGSSALHTGPTQTFCSPQGRCIH